MRRLYFFAFLFVGVALGPGMAHLFELPNKLQLAREDYFTVQRIYAGWSLFAFVILGEFLTLGTLVVKLRRWRLPALWAVAALLSVIGAQALFWTFTYPANVATDNWSMIPQNWELLRNRWEFSHGAAALLDFAALLFLVLSLLNWRPESATPAGRAATAAYSSNSATGPESPRPISSL